MNILFITFFCKIYGFLDTDCVRIRLLSYFYILFNIYIYCYYYCYFFLVESFHPIKELR